MRAVQGLVPARFLTMISHLVIVVTMFWSLDANVLACLPTSYTTAEFDSQRTFLIVLLSITLFFFLIELIGFVAGFSMFNSSQSLLSIAAHTGASVSLSFFIFDEWECSLYWYIFWFCSFLPAFTEICTIIAVVAFKRGF